VLKTVEFVNKYGEQLIKFLEDNETDITDKEDIKSTLAAWFSDNAGNPEIAGTMSADGLTELFYNALNE
jgi:hypothetical protein